MLNWRHRLYQFVRSFREENKSELVAEEIYLEHLNNWLEKRQLELITQARLEDESVAYVNKLKDKRWFLESKIEEWERLLSVKEIFYGKEDIRSFFVQTKELLLLWDFDQGISVQEIIHLNPVLLQNLKKIIIRLEKSSFAHNFSFLFDENSSGEEFNPLFSLLLGLQDLVENFNQKLAQSGIKKFESLVLSKDRLEEHVEKICQLNNLLNEKNERLHATQRKIQEKELQLAELKKDPLYQELEEELNQKKFWDEKRRRNALEIIEFFSELKPVLEEYRQFTSENTQVDAYLSDPLDAFTKDENLFIIHLLKHLKAVLTTGKIEIPLNQLTVLTPLIDRGISGYLENLYRQRFISKEKPQSSFLDKDLLLRMEEAEYRLNHFSQQVEILRKQVIEIEMQVKNEEKIKEQEQILFRDMVKVNLNKSVKLFI